MGTRYAEVEEALRLGLSGRSFSPDDLKTGLGGNLDAASAEADSYLGNQYTLPITGWGDDLKAAVSKIAVYEFLSVRGLNPDAGSSDANVRDRAKDARAWLQRVGEGKATPTGIVDSTPGNVAGTPGSDPEVVSASTRGWSSRGDSRAGGPFTSD